MVRSKLVKHWIVNGRKMIKLLAARGLAIRAAYWAWDGEGNPWYLYVVVDSASSHSTLDLWDYLQSRGIEDFNMLSALRIVDRNDRRAVRVSETLERNKVLARTYRGSDLASELGLDSFYIYPTRYYEATLAPMTAKDVGHALLGFMQGDAPPANWPRIHLKTGQDLVGKPTRITRANGHGLQVEFETQDDGLRSVNLEDIASIA